MRKRINKIVRMFFNPKKNPLQTETERAIKEIIATLDFYKRIDRKEVLKSVIKKCLCGNYHLHRDPRKCEPCAQINDAQEYREGKEYREELMAEEKRI
jgi:hypothetical protein